MLEGRRIREVIDDFDVRFKVYTGYVAQIVHRHLGMLFKQLGDAESVRCANGDRDEAIGGIDDRWTDEAIR